MITSYVLILFIEEFLLFVWRPSPCYSLVLPAKAGSDLFHLPHFLWCGIEELNLSAPYEERIYSPTPTPVGHIPHCACLSRLSLLCLVRTVGVEPTPVRNLNPLPLPLGYVRSPTNLSNPMSMSFPPYLRLLIRTGPRACVGHARPTGARPPPSG